MSDCTSSSQNYQWDASKPIGEGATSLVFYGRHKLTFDEVAVKVFKSNAMNRRPVDVLYREFEVLRKLKRHENIVHLIAMEEEKATRCKTIVMELCLDSSVQFLLNTPRYKHGLPEEHFLDVLKNISAGLQFLRSNGVIHRDIKPDNIMAHHNKDGRTVYKLTDFGAARELEEDEQFMSLYGTEEYLHPDMYDTAVLRREYGKKFSANTDLWSLGVTLYHTATGQLPFRPIGGRRNRETMYRIITEKESGVISGYQSAENSQIHWSRSLPDSVSLSRSLQSHLVPILAGLLETDATKVWSYQKFFDAVQRLDNMHALDVFIASLWELDRVYINPNESLDTLSQTISQLYDLRCNEHLLFHDGNPLSSLVHNESHIKDLPNTICEKNPVIVVNLSHKSARNLAEFTEYSALPDISTTDQFDRSDYMLSMTICSYVHKMNSILTSAHSKQNLLRRTVNVLICHYEKEVMRLRDFLNRQRQLLIYVDSMRNCLNQSAGSPGRQSNIHHCDKSNNNDCVMSGMNKTYIKVESEVHAADVSMSSKMHEINHLKTQKWHTHGCQSYKDCQTKFTSNLSRMEKICNIFKSRRKAAFLSRDEQSLHAFQKKQFREYRKEAQMVLLEGCGQQSIKQWQEFIEWLRLAIERDKGLQFLDNELQSISKTLHKCQEEIQNCLVMQNDRIVQSRNESCNNMMDGMVDYESPRDSLDFVVVNVQPNRTEYANILQDSRQDLHDVIKTISENTELIHSLKLNHGSSCG